MDIVYVLGRGSQWNNEEIRYSLRSICKFTKHDNVYVIGEKPYFAKDIIHIPVNDFNKKEYSIYNKIRIACNIPELSEEFLFMNDDHFFVKEVDIDNYPFYHQDDLTVEIQKRLRSPYRTEIERTYAYLKDKVKSPKYYDIHTPIRYNKNDFLEIMIQTPIHEQEMIIKSLYANMKGVKGTFRKDIKLLAVDFSRVRGVDCFSVGDRCNYRALKRYLDGLYGDQPCKYERIN